MKIKLYIFVGLIVLLVFFLFNQLVFGGGAAFLPDIDILKRINSEIISWFEDK